VTENIDIHFISIEYYHQILKFQVNGALQLLMMFSKYYHTVYLRSYQQGNETFLCVLLDNPYLSTVELSYKIMKVTEYFLSL
jgi:hypothetical protein